MPDTTKVRLKGPGPVKHFPGGFVLRDDKGKSLVVNPGDVVEVPADLAGKPPKGEPDHKTYDPGSGLLAQTDVWEPGPKSVPAENTPEEG